MKHTIVATAVKALCLLTRAQYQERTQTQANF